MIFKSRSVVQQEWDGPMATGLALGDWDGIGIRERHAIQTILWTNTFFICLSLTIFVNNFCKNFEI